MAPKGDLGTRGFVRDSSRTTPEKDSLYTFMTFYCQAWLGIALFKGFTEFTSFST
ncbi:MAG: hypothetical protein WCP15_02065 [bacterium]